MTDTPTRLPTHDRLWISATDLRVGDSVPQLGKVEGVNVTAVCVEFWARWTARESYELALDSELWIDREVIR